MFLCLNNICINLYFFFLFFFFLFCIMLLFFIAFFFFFSSRRRHTRFLNVTGVQTCALPINDTAYEISECDWSSDVCSSDLTFRNLVCRLLLVRSEEHTSELQSHSEISYAVFCL